MRPELVAVAGGALGGAGGALGGAGGALGGAGVDASGGADGRGALFVGAAPVEALGPGAPVELEPATPLEPGVAASAGAPLPVSLGAAELCPVVAVSSCDGALVGVRAVSLE
ncbi:MAG: hypothetical protein HY908_18585 [Myxococcales bacterium]|nr:hypothetical protein [Myxococcales bacterium]